MYVCVRVCVFQLITSAIGAHPSSKSLMVRSIQTIDNIAMANQEYAALVIDVSHVCQLVMRLCVCMCVLVRVLVYVCVCTYVRMHACMCVCTCMYVCMYVCAFVHVCMYVCTCVGGWS